MASSGNFSTMNPLNRTSGSVVYTNGNLSFSPGSSWSSTTFTRNNMYIPKDKKIYFELYHKTQSGYYAGYGFGAENAPVTSSEFGATGCITTYYGDTRVNGTRTQSQFTSPSQGDIVQFAIDGSNNKVWFGINNTWVLSGDPANGSNEIGTITTNSTVGFDISFIAQQNSASTLTMNFGQDSSFAGDVTAGGNADGNGFGDFKYTPPTGFLALCSANLSVSSDIDPAQTSTDYSGTQFNVVTYTGNGSDGHGITGVDFQPDFVWLKKRSASASHQLYDSSRGAGKLLSSDGTGAEATYSTVLQSFDSDGFTLGTSAAINGSSATMVGWCWRANGGVTSSNSDGASTTTVQANTKAGFSIVEFPNYSSNSTFGHGLSSAPEFITARLTGGSRWATYHTGLTSAGNYVSLNTDSAQASGSFFNSTAPTSSVFSLGASFGGSGAGICYAWHSVEGYSKFGTYEGNADNDGTFVYTGFRPRLLFIKNSDGQSPWVIYDGARDGYNLSTSPKQLFWNGTEADHTSYPADILSNGFKLRTSNATVNASGTWIYGAWGDVPFKYNNTF
tara:strand:+ start:437 stop:2119 length:1683 start_codon:yes stop_codon:yes gene_type:complete